MTEIDVTLTDYLLFLQAAWFAKIIQARKPLTALTPYFVLMFAGFAAASFLGGTSHGFFNDPSMPLYRPVWWLTLLATGVAAAGFGLAGIGMLRMTWLPPARLVALFALLGYAAVTWRNDDYLMAIYFYLPATVLCFAGFLVSQRRHSGKGIYLGMIGIAVAWAASAMQQAEITLHPVYLTHNALYHVILVPALYLIFIGATRVVANTENPR